MQNLEEIKTEFAKKFDKYSFEFEDETMGEIIDYWLKKWQERELALWQAMEEKKREIYCKPNHIKTVDGAITICYQYSLEGGYNQALSEAQSLLSVKEKENN